MKDKFVLGATGGVAGAAVMAGLNFLINRIPGIDMKLVSGVSELFVSRSLVGTLQGNTIGLLVHLVCGALVGLAFLTALELTGYDYLLLKGAFLGLAAWLQLCGILGRILGLNMQDKFIDNVLFLLIHIPFGIVTVWVIDRLRYRPTA